MGLRWRQYRPLHQSEQKGLAQCMCIVADHQLRAALVIAFCQSKQNFSEVRFRARRKVEACDGSRRFLMREPFEERRLSRTARTDEGRPAVLPRAGRTHARYGAGVTGAPVQESRLRCEPE